jgi:UDP-N-acetylmuramoyl-tripeptide--D-alanyl-D-alanine ligase
MQPIQHPDGVTFIRDDWKAPLWSMPAALQFMREARARRNMTSLCT